MTEWITACEAAKRLRMDHVVLLSLIGQQCFPAFRSCKGVLVDARHVQELIDRGVQGDADTGPSVGPPEEDVKDGWVWMGDDADTYLEIIKHFAAQTAAA